jgi:hypothetical protein
MPSIADADDDALTDDEAGADVVPAPLDVRLIRSFFSPPLTYRMQLTTTILDIVAFLRAVILLLLELLLLTLLWAILAAPQRFFTDPSTTCAASFAE